MAENDALADAFAAIANPMPARVRALGEAARHLAREEFGPAFAPGALIDAGYSARGCA